MQRKQGKMSVMKQDEAGGSIQPDVDCVFLFFFSKVHNCQLSKYQCPQWIPGSGSVGLKIPEFLTA